MKTQRPRILSGEIVAARQTRYVPSIMRTLLVALALSLGLPSTAWAIPAVGRPFPTFSVEDLTRTARTQRDLAGRWTVVLAMTDKDIGPALREWYRRIEPLAPPGGRLLTFAALSLFPMIPTATIFSQARDATPRTRWAEVWLSRDGSLATSLGLPDSEEPWIFVVDPWGRVVESLHGPVDNAGLLRVAAALNRARTPAPPR